MKVTSQPRYVVTIAFGITIGSGWLIIFYLAATNAIPYNSSSVRLFGREKQVLRAMLPEGFSFFTRNPREPQVELFSMDGNQVDLNNNAPAHLFGLSRYSRALNLEISVIWNAVRDQAWYDCNSDTCLEAGLIPNYVIAESFPQPFLTGEYYLKVSEPVPWAWARTFRKTGKAMPFKIVSITIQHQ